MRNTKKNISFYTWPTFWSILSIVLSLISIYEEKLIQYWGWDKNIFLFVPIAILISTILVFMSVIQSVKKELDNYEDVTKWIKDNPNYQNALTDHIDSIALYKKYDDKVLQITVSDFDDFFVLMPLHIAKKKSGCMNLTIVTSPSRSDKEALDKIADPEKEFMFAITDPSYLIDPTFNKKYKDLVIIAPLVCGVPLWLLAKENNTLSNLLTVSTDTEVYTGRVVDGLFKNAISNTDTVDSIESEMRDIYLKDKNCNKILRKYFASLFEQQRSKKKDSHKEIINKIGFSHLLFLFSGDWAPSTKESMRTLFKRYDAFFLTDPEMSYIRKTILNDTKEYKILDEFDGKIINKALKKERTTGHYTVYSSIEDEKKDENKIIFTAVIANKRKMQSNPIMALRFLRCLQIGILKTNIALTTTENTENFQEIFAGSTNTHKELYTTAFKDIKNNEFLIKDNNYPNDLYIPKKRGIASEYNEYESFLLSEEDIINNEALNLIINGIPC